MSTSFRPVDEQLRVIRRGLVDLVDERDLRERLTESAAKGRPLRVKLGIDPSSPDIHIGHTVVLRKLRDFQDLGHTAVLLWGTATAMVGDPTGRNKTRPQLTREMVVAHQATYRAQVGRVLDVSRIEERENGAWFDQMSFMDAVKLAARYTVAQLLERDTFQERYRRREPIAVHEFLYPLMQGYDSVQLEADVELGGTDQLFNLLVGRELQRHEGQRPQVCLTVPILEGLDGVQKMSKSLGNHIGVLEPVGEMFRKVMKIRPDAIAKWFELLTDVPADQVGALVARSELDARLELATRVAESFHGASQARAARQEFEAVRQGGQLPSQIETWTASGSPTFLATELSASGIVASSSEGRRKIQEGAVWLAKEDPPDSEGLRAETDPKRRLEPGTYVVRVGKGRFLRIVVPPSAS